MEMFIKHYTIVMPNTNMKTTIIIICYLFPLVNILVKHYKKIINTSNTHPNNKLVH